jgi:hypothetical protein
MKKERGIRRSLLQRCATYDGIAQYRASTIPLICIQVRGLKRMRIAGA